MASAGRAVTVGHSGGKIVMAHVGALASAGRAVTVNALAVVDGTGDAGEAPKQTGADL